MDEKTETDILIDWGLLLRAKILNYRREEPQTFWEWLLGFHYMLILAGISMTIKWQSLFIDFCSQLKPGI